MENKLAIIIVLYHPDIESLNNQLNNLDEYHVILVDNTPLINVSEQLVLSDNTEYLPLMANKGIGHAQNLGIERAISIGFDYCLFLDQDSKVECSFPKSLLSEMEYLESIRNDVALLCSTSLELVSSKSYKKHEYNIESRYAKVQHVQSSGSLIKVTTFRNIGLFKEDLFIDLVDNEWCWRANHNGLACYVARNVSMLHSAGSRSFKIVGKMTHIPSAFRWYYLMRNAIFLTSMPHTPKRWISKFILMVPFKIVIFLPFIKERKKLIASVAKGTIDGLQSLRKKKIVGDISI